LSQKTMFLVKKFPNLLEMNNVVTPPNEGGGCFGRVDWRDEKKRGGLVGGEGGGECVGDQGEEMPRREDEPSCTQLAVTGLPSEGGLPMKKKAVPGRTGLGGEEKMENIERSATGW